MTEYTYVTNELCKVTTKVAVEGAQFGWQFKDVDWSGAHVNILMQQKIVK